MVALDIDPHRVELVNDRKAPIVDAELEDYLSNRDLDLRATTDPREAFAGADYAIIATPTNYDEERNFFDTSSVDAVLAELEPVSYTHLDVYKRQACRRASAGRWPRRPPSIRS